MGRVPEKLQSLILAALFGASWTSVALASKNKGRIEQNVFILRAPGKTAIVSPAKNSPGNDATYMRMPDQGHNSTTVVDMNAATNTASDADVEQAHPKTNGAESQTTASNKKALKKVSNQSMASKILGYERRLKEHSVKEGLSFSRVKIEGKVRLPRVKFARVGMTMELRDESPSLDFTDKTLKDSGY
jgi:hypothetical protein